MATITACGYHIYIQNSSGCVGATDTLTIVQAPQIGAILAHVHAAMDQRMVK